MPTKPPYLQLLVHVGQHRGEAVAGRAPGGREGGQANGSGEWRCHAAQSTLGVRLVPSPVHHPSLHGLPPLPAITNVH